MKRRSILKLLLATTVIPMLPSMAAAQDEKVLRVAMTVADVPMTTGQPNQGYDGRIFIGTTLYDALVNWDLTSDTEAATLVPGLAESWTVDEADPTKWTFRLRQGVKFHDGSDFDAAAVVFNMDKLINKDSPQFDQAQATQAAGQTARIAGYRAIDSQTVEITTRKPDATLLYQLVEIWMSSPARWEEMDRDWSKVAPSASGTGPWMLDKLVPRERAELVRNPTYWNPDRIAKSDRMVLYCMPDATTRVAALLYGQVDFVEAPPTDALGQIEASGMQVFTNRYPHVWPHQLSVLEDSPFADIRIRKAANLAIDREGISQFLGGTAIPAKGMVTDNHPWFGTPSFELRYDPEAAKALLAVAGYGPENPVKAKFIVSASGSGMMQPLPMNEYIQQNLRDVGIEVELDVLERETLRSRRRAGADAPENAGAHSVNNSWGFYDPNIALLDVFSSTSRPPAGYNWGAYAIPEIDTLIEKARVEFDSAAQDALLAEIHAKVVDEALWIWVVHDLNPRALGANVRGFVQAQSWFQDLTQVYVER